MSRRKYRSLRSSWPAVVLACPIVVYVTFQIVMFLYRPMFHNVFGRNDRMLFSMWVEGPSFFDQSDNVAIADYRLNVLVVFLTGDSDIDFAGFINPCSVEDGVVFPDTRYVDDLDVAVARQEDALIVFHSDGSRSDFPLAPGEAKSVHSALGSDPEDFRPILSQLYARKHSVKEFSAWLHGGAD